MQLNFVRTKGCDWSIKPIYKDRDSSIVRKQLILVLVSCSIVKAKLTCGLAVRFNKKNVNISNMNCSVPSK